MMLLVLGNLYSCSISLGIFGWDLYNVTEQRKVPLHDGGVGYLWVSFGFRWGSLYQDREPGT